MVRIALEQLLGLEALAGAWAVTMAMSLSGLVEGPCWPLAAAASPSCFSRRAPQDGRCPSFSAMADAMPERQNMIGRELTKLHDEVLRGAGSAPRRRTSRWSRSTSMRRPTLFAKRLASIHPTRPCSSGLRGAGQVLYRGPFGVLGAGTAPAIGLGFRAFPILDFHQGRMAVRVWDATAGEAARNVVRLFRGVRCMPGGHEWLLTHCRMDFDREVPLEVGGDLEGTRPSVEFRLSDQRVNLVDWGAARTAGW